MIMHTMHHVMLFLQVAAPCLVCSSTANSSEAVSPSQAILETSLQCCAAYSAPMQNPSFLTWRILLYSALVHAGDDMVAKQKSGELEKMLKEVGVAKGVAA